MTTLKLLFLFMFIVGCSTSPPYKPPRIYGGYGPGDRLGLVIGKPYVDQMGTARPAELVK